MQLVLIQNRKDAIVETFQVDRLDFQPRYEENESFVSITVPRSPSKVLIDQALGFIRYEKKSGELRLANGCAQLRPKILQLGKTTKQNKNNFAGCHGEGLKLAAMVMSRNGYKVSVATSNYTWSFTLRETSHSIFGCVLTPSRSTAPQAQTDPVQDMALFTPRVWRDVCCN